MTGQGQHPMDLLPLAAAGSLAVDQLDAVDEHVAGCPACAAELAEWLRIAAATRAAERIDRARPLQRRRQPPRQVPRDQPQVISPGLRSHAVGPQLVRIQSELLSEAGHRDRRRTRHLVRHEPQPRQRAQRHRQPKTIRPTLDARPRERILSLLPPTKGPQRDAHRF